MNNNTPNTANKTLVDALAKITAERDTFAAELADKDAMIRELAAYLSSDKFKADPTVSVSDVLSRLGMR